MLCTYFEGRQLPSSDKDIDLISLMAVMCDNYRFLIDSVISQLS